MKTVLVTGATGAIGSAVVPLFLQEPRTQVRVLLRADSEEHLQDRLADLWRFWEVDPAKPGADGRVVALRGDVSQPLLGLREEEYHRQVREVTHLIHTAGNVSLNLSLDQARRESLESARYVVAFVKGACREGSFRKLEYLSTIGVAGRMEGVIPEQRLGRPREFHNTYEEAKAEAEDLVWDEVGRGLPATIHRPSMVVGDSRTGKIIHFQVFYHLSEFLAGLRTWGFVPDTETFRLDLIPADYVARAIVLASDRPDTIGRVFHLCSGSEHAWPLSDLARRLQEIFASFGQRVPSRRAIKVQWIEAMLPILLRIVPQKTRRALQGLPYFLAYLDGSQVFDNSRTRAYFAPLGLELPVPQAYLETLMRYYWQVRKARRRPRSAERAA